MSPEDIAHMKYKKGWVCPSCNNVSTEYPALSRRDNKTDICSACGIGEALEDYAVYLSGKGKQ